MSRNDAAQLDALHAVQAVVELALDGTILAANELFLTTVGYSLAQLKGQPHRMLVEARYAASEAYARLWADLRDGLRASAELLCVGNGGRAFVLHGSYVPVRDDAGRLERVIAFVRDVSDERLLRASFQAQIEAIHKTQAVVELALDGTILDANRVFLQAMEYELHEIKGRHHRMFVEAEQAGSRAYERFWADLAAGVSQSGEFRRLTRSGRPIWIRGTYNPILGLDGRPIKIVKFALDITAEKLKNLDAQSQLEAIRRTLAVVELDLNGNVITANDLFLSALGYTLEEIKGRHHRMFVEPHVAKSEPYAQFWRELAAGKHHSAEYKRVGKGGRTVWIQGSYNPLLDLDGKPTRIIKYAIDVTSRVLGQERERALAKRLEQTLHDVAASSKTLSAASSELGTIARQMSDNARETATQAGVVAQAAGRVTRHARTVASGTSAMSTSMDVIARNAVDAASVGEQAVRVAEKTTTAINKLGDSSREIGEVIKTITAVARQTNLLALNATIEAARAGELGKGFAVVANEVKALARQTASATEDIGRRIEAIQTDSRNSIGAIAEIGTIIRQINALQIDIAAGVEEQRVTTHEMGINVAEATQASAEIAKNINAVAEAADQSATGSATTEAAAQDLARIAAALEQLATSFGVGTE